MLRPQQTALALAVLAVLVLAGCGQAGRSGGGDFTGEAAKVAAVLENLQTAARDRDTRRICRFLLDPALARRLGNCDRAVTAILDRSDSFDLAVRDVRLVGAGRARARVRSGGTARTDRIVGLVRTGGDWRLADVGRRVAG